MNTDDGHILSTALVLTVAGEVIPALLRDDEVSLVSVADRGGFYELAITLHDKSRFVMNVDDAHPAPPELAFYLFLELQDFVSESETGWGDPRPLCPGHNHPRNLVYANGELWWRCPVEMTRQERAFTRLTPEAGSTHRSVVGA